MTAPRWIPDEIVEEKPSAEEINLKRSLRLIMIGKRMGWVDAMLETGVRPRSAQHEREMRERFEKIADEKYPIPTGSAA